MKIVKPEHDHGGIRKSKTRDTFALFGQNFCKHNKLWTFSAVWKGTLINVNTAFPSEKMYIIINVNVNFYASECLR